MKTTEEIIKKLKIEANKVRSVLHEIDSEHHSQIYLYNIAQHNLLISLIKFIKGEDEPEA
jgi:hypothetical protein